MLITSRQTLVMSAADSIKEGLCDISQIKEKETNHDKTGGEWGSVHFGGCVSFFVTTARLFGEYQQRES